MVTGTEVLTARITDRNGPWLSERLAELGMDVSHIICVGDRRADLVAALTFLPAYALGPLTEGLTPQLF